MKLKSLFAVVLSLALLSCGGEKGAINNKAFRIVCTTTMIWDAAQNLAPQGVEVFPLMKPGIDPHYFKPTLDDLALLRSADVILFNGLELEGKMTDILQKLGGDKIVSAVSEGFAPESYLRHGSAIDPHVWFDPMLWSQSVQNIATTLSKALPNDAVAIDERLKVFQDSLNKIHNWTIEQLNTIPEGNKIMFTSHDAFSYFSRAYSFRVKGLQGITTTAEFGLRDVTNMVDSIIKLKIPAVFTEQSVPPKYIEAVVEGCRQRGYSVNLGGELFSDSLGEADTEEGTYLGTVRSNVNLIVRALK
ncbi:zinc ABC transporter substrate-binding protein [Salibacteraceae bacterium]|jgi:manganese/zinc/iron transport system substrate-binding protein|nr:zinc ABC transporter substrate-binding protein [Salibacteraceae bacterium]